MLYIEGGDVKNNAQVRPLVKHTNDSDMRYMLQDLPEPIRQQVEDYIDFLMEKYQLSTPVQDTTSSTEVPGRTFAQRWRGVAKGVDPDAAKAAYLNEKYL